MKVDWRRQRLNAALADASRMLGRDVDEASISIPISFLEGGAGRAKRQGGRGQDRPRRVQGAAQSLTKATERFSRAEVPLQALCGAGAEAAPC